MLSRTDQLPESGPDRQKGLYCILFSIMNWDQKPLVIVLMSCPLFSSGETWNKKGAPVLNFDAPQEGRIFPLSGTEFSLVNFAVSVVGRGGCFYSQLR